MPCCELVSRKSGPVLLLLTVLLLLAVHARGIMNIDYSTLQDLATQQAADA